MFTNGTRNVQKIFIKLLVNIIQQRRKTNLAYFIHLLSFFSTSTLEELKYYVTTYKLKWKSYETSALSNASFYGPWAFTIPAQETYFIQSVVAYSISYRISVKIPIEFKKILPLGKKCLLVQRRTHVFSISGSVFPFTEKVHLWA